MGLISPTADPANVTQALVYTLLDVFDATRDTLITLRKKEIRDREDRLRARGYPESRRIEYVDEESLGSDEGVVLDKSAVTREFELGFQGIGAQFAIGDVVSQTALQSQIITLQSALITTFLYGPTSGEPISHLISGLLAASRAAGTIAVDVLEAQHQRQAAARPHVPRSAHSPVKAGFQPPYPATTLPSTSTALVRSHREDTVPLVDTATLANPTIADIRSRPEANRTDTESTSFSGMTSYDTSNSPPPVYCPYAQDLQRHPSQEMASAITDTSAPYCPYCRRDLNLAPGRSWEIYKNAHGMERCFRLQNRFVVKCHCDGVNGGYLCVLCTRNSNVSTVCGDVKALVRHVWMDHNAAELETDEDIIQVVDGVDRRRDSGASFSDSRKGSSRRSMSLGPGKGRRRLIEREVETLEIRPRRDG